MIEDGPNVELALSQLANEAMAAGKNPQVTTEKLRQMIAYLRANPDLARNANEALAKGKTSGDIARVLMGRMQQGEQQVVEAQQGAPSDVTAARARPPEEPKPVPTRGFTLRDLGTAARYLAPGGTALAGAPSREDVQHFAREAGPEALSSVQWIPGMKEAQAGLRMPFTGESPQQAVKAVDRYTNIPTSHRIVGQALTAAPLTEATPFLRGLSPAKQGMAIGGAQGLLNADNSWTTPEGWRDRLLKATGGAAMGGLIGKVADVGGTLAEAKAGPSFSQQHYEFRDMARRINNKNFGEALAKGSARVTTPAVRDLLDNPDFVKVAARLSASQRFRGMSPTDPRFLDRAIKLISEEQATAAKAVNQSLPGGTRTQMAASASLDLDDAQLLKQQALKAFQEAGRIHIPEITTTVPPQQGPMTPSEVRSLMSGPNRPTTLPLESATGRLVQGWPRPSGPTETLAPAQDIDVPALMPEYIPAHATSADLAGTQKARSFGYRALRSRGKKLPGERDELQHGAEGVADFLKRTNADAVDRAAMVGGIQGGLKRAPLFAGWGHYARSAPGLIREAGSSPTFADILAKTLSPTATSAAYQAMFGKPPEEEPPPP